MRTIAWAYLVQFSKSAFIRYTYIMHLVVKWNKHSKLFWLNSNGIFLICSRWWIFRAETICLFNLLEKEWKNVRNKTKFVLICLSPADAVNACWPICIYRRINIPFDNIFGDIFSIICVRWLFFFSILYKVYLYKFRRLVKYGRNNTHKQRKTRTSRRLIIVINENKHHVLIFVNGNN